VIKGITLKNVKSFKYVGGTENNVAGMDDEIAIRLQRMAAAYSRFDQRIFSNRNIYLRVKLRVFGVFVVPNGLYGCVTWNLTDLQLKRLESFQFRHIRKVFGFVWQDKVSYEYLIDAAKQVGVQVIPLECKIRMLRLKYLGHVERMDDSRLPKIVLHGDVTVDDVDFSNGYGCRQPGSQEMSYRQRIRKDLLDFDINENSWSVLAQDRDGWRKAVCVDGIARSMDKWLLKRAKVRSARKLAQISRKKDDDDNDLIDCDVANTQQFEEDGIGNRVLMVGRCENIGDGNNSKTHKMEFLMKQHRVEIDYEKLERARRLGWICTGRGEREHKICGDVVKKVVKILSHSRREIDRLLLEQDNDILQPVVCESNMDSESNCSMVLTAQQPIYRIKAERRNRKVVETRLFENIESAEVALGFLGIITTAFRNLDEKNARGNAQKACTYPCAGGFVFSRIV